MTGSLRLDGGRFWTVGLNGLQRHTLVSCQIPDA
jgi:hypothetical protein